MTIHTTRATFAETFRKFELARFRNEDTTVIKAATIGARLLRTKVPKDTGNLQRQTHVTVAERHQGSAGVVCSIIEDTPYAKAMEYGTKPFWAPIAPLIEWAERQAPNIGLERTASFSKRMKAQSKHAMKQGALIMRDLARRQSKKNTKAGVIRTKSGRLILRDDAIDAAHRRFKLAMRSDVQGAQKHSPEIVSFAYAVQANIAKHGLRARFHTRNALPELRAILVACFAKRGKDTSSVIHSDSESYL